jgi:hypothetical protein
LVAAGNYIVDGSSGCHLATKDALDKFLEHRERTYVSDLAAMVDRLHSRLVLDTHGFVRLTVLQHRAAQVVLHCARYSTRC